MRKQSGISLIEVMIAMVIFGIVVALGLPSFAAWIQNIQLRNAAESTQAGLQYARAEAIKRNTLVRFQLVTSIDNNCALDTSGPDYVVSLDNPTGNCGAAFSDTVAPRILQVKRNAEGSNNAVFFADATAISFNGLGRTSGAGISTIVVTNPVGGNCQTSADLSQPMRCLQLSISPGGEIRMCDPVVVDATDPRIC
jgi:type IV fimbrial biogenesis protein FimT